MKSTQELEREENLDAATEPYRYSTEFWGDSPGKSPRLTLARLQEELRMVVSLRRDEDAEYGNGVSWYHVQQVLKGTAKPSAALLDAMQLARVVEGEWEPEGEPHVEVWPDGRELTTEDKAAISLCVHKADQQSLSPGQSGIGHYDLSSHLVDALVETSACKNADEADYEQYGRVFLAGKLYAQRFGTALNGEENTTHNVTAQAKGDQQ